MSRHNIFALLLFWGLYSYLNTAAAAGNTTLSSYNITYLQSSVRLDIEFQPSMSYVSHFPAASGKTLKINMRELLPSAQPSNRLIEQLIVSQNKQNPVLEIKYEKERVEDQAGTLIIEFDRLVDFEVTLQRSRKKLSVKLKNIYAISRGTTAAGQADALDSGLPVYVLKLKTAQTEIDAQQQSALKNYHAYDIYVTQEKTRWKTQYTLNLGYFFSRKVAQANLERLKPFYPRMWIGTVSPERRQIADTWFLNRRVQRVKKRAKNVSDVKPEKIDILMERARQAMIDKKYKQAIRILTRIQELGGGKYKKAGKELLGLARERNNQFAHAKAEYREYLKLYPEGEDAERVKQRLIGLVTARARPKEKLGVTGVQGREPEWDFFGSLAQFYRRQTNSIDGAASTTTDSSILSDVVYTGRKRGLKYNQRFDFAASHRYDFLSNDEESDGRIQTLYYELSRRDDSFGLRVGRQTHSTDGIFGRFDGIIFNKSAGKGKKINFLAGYPVELSNGDGIQTDRQFYGLSFDVDALVWNTDFKFYYIEQTNNDLTDREAIGIQAKYASDYTSYFAALDYDTFYAELNQLSFTGTWRSKKDSTLNVVADFRKSPLLTTENALIGQTVLDIPTLRQTFSDDEIYQLARDRTADYRSLTVSASTFLSKRYQLNGDITVSDLDSTIASGGVDATQGTGAEMFYGTNLVITNFFTGNDTTIFGLRYSDTATSSITQFNYSTNFNVSKKWRINPRLVVDSRDNNNNSTRATIRPRLIVNYRPSRSIKYELDLGYENAETTSSVATTTESSFYVFFGYIYDF